MERAARKWRRYDEETLTLLTPVHEDFEAYASIVRARRTELAQLFEKDRAEVADVTPRRALGTIQPK